MHGCMLPVPDYACCICLCRQHKYTTAGPAASAVPCRTALVRQQEPAVGTALTHTGFSAVSILHTHCCADKLERQHHLGTGDEILSSRSKVVVTKPGQVPAG